MNIKSNFLKESLNISKKINNGSFGINSIKSGYAQLFYIYDNKLFSLVLHLIKEIVIMVNNINMYVDY
jgi:hypothetical protein